MEENQNSHWGSGRFAPSAPTGTAFDRRVRELGLTDEMFASSRELRRWCEENCERCYVPEWLLKKWGVRVEPNLS